MKLVQEWKLTDDEITAIVLNLGVPWSYGLPTVEALPELVYEAGARGTRSLVARDLMRTSDSGIVVDDDLARIVTAAGEPAQMAVGYVTEVASPTSLFGSSNYLFLPQGGSGTALVDFVTAAGLHSIMELPVDEATEMFIAVIENAFRFGIATPEGEDVSPVLVVVVGDDPDSPALLVRSGSIAHGRLVGDDDRAFVQEMETDEWSAGDVRSVLGLV